jgi:hypothetical protein
MVLLTRKIIIYPTKKQQIVLWELAETCRLLYNHALAERQFLYNSYWLFRQVHRPTECLNTSEKTVSKISAGLLESSTNDT